MKENLALLLLLLAFPSPAFSQTGAETALSILGKFRPEFTERKMPDGSITEIGLGIDYYGPWSGFFKLRYNTEIRNESFDLSLPDSLNTIDQKIFEWYLLPARYRLPVADNVLVLNGGAGVYINSDRLKEQGYFEMPALESLGFASVNSFSNDSRMTIAGPLLEVRADFNPPWKWEPFFNKRVFSAAFTCGVVPVFSMDIKQTISMRPIISTTGEKKQSITGKPYFYLDLGLTLLEHAAFNLFYDVTFFNYDALDFGPSGDGTAFVWTSAGQDTVTSMFKFEFTGTFRLGSYNVVLGPGMAMNSVTLNGASPLSRTRWYFTFRVN